MPLPKNKGIIHDVKKGFSKLKLSGVSQTVQSYSATVLCCATVARTHSLGGYAEIFDAEGFGSLPEALICYILSSFADRSEAVVMRGVCKAWRDAFDFSTRCLAIHSNLALLPQHSAAFPNLQQLMVSHTNSASVKAAVEVVALPSTKLTSLELCNVSSLHAVPADVHRLTSLKTLVITSSHLRTLASSYLHLLPKLEHLDLQNNDLTDLPASIGSLGKTLRKLNVSENEVSYLPEGLGGLTMLHTLRASNNLLLELPDALMQLSSLTKLDLSYNRLKQLPDHVTNLTGLKQLSLFAGFSHSLRNEGSATIKALAQLSVDAPDMHLQAEEVVLSLVRLRKKQLLQAAAAAADDE